MTIKLVIFFINSLISTCFLQSELPTPITNRGIYVPATSCYPIKCLLPKCRCAGTGIPGGLTKDNTPQIIMFTMDDGITQNNFQLYQDLLNGLKNFNGCPVKATFFLSGDNTDYSLVKVLQNQGHEIGDHSMTHRDPVEWWNQNSYIDLEFEVINQRKAIEEMVGVTTRGWRTPFLASTENIFSVLADNNFLYDSTLGTYPRTRWWPYTLDYLPPISCYKLNCPLNSYPGLWEVPLVPWQCNATDEVFGTMIDECKDPGDEESVYEMIMRNFKTHYDDNKQPFPIFGHSSWFNNAPYKRTALIRFMNEVVKLNDVFFVTVQDAVKWTQLPIGLNGNPFSCL
ncbi:chitin deacetylase 8 [Hydra vulgaris]|uniref:Chitin deacetylase 8 n=1 Tax=Hydra vulgaris TaxID=6087 RepID=A0ABM4C9T7_HYDVU